MTEDGEATASMWWALKWQAAGPRLRARRALHGENSEVLDWCSCLIDSWQEKQYATELGSPKRKLHSKAIAIYTLCRQNNINLEPEWVPRK